MGRDVGASEQRLPEELLGRVLGTCTLERILGRGGMGVVYLAQQSRPHRQVAVKVLLLSLMPDQDRRSRFLARFRREADAVAALDHPNILPIYEYGEQDDLAYLVMPYVTGGTLRDRVERKGALPLQEVAGFLTQMAVALDYAHRHGVIHRDVKPQNMLLYPDKRLMLSDFGIAKIAEQAASDGGDTATLPQLTTMGHVVGTPDYIAPEQAMGNDVDARADIYSLGVVLFYMVTGRVPFAGAQPMTVAAKHVSEPPPPPRQFRPDLPIAAERVILKAMEKNPAARYQTAGALAQAFQAAISAQAGPAPAPAAAKAGVPAVVPQQPPANNNVGRPTRRIENAERPPRRLGLAMFITALIVLLVAGGVYAAIKYSQSHTNNQPTPTTGITRTVPPTQAPTATPTKQPTVTPSPNPTATTTPAKSFQATQFEPQQSDLPNGTTAQQPQTATTSDQYQNLKQNLVVDPTKGKYNWQEEVLVEIDQNGGSSYLKLFIEQFNQTSDALQYYNDVLPHLRSVKHTEQIGQQETDGLCCDDGGTSPNVIFQDENVVVIVLEEVSSDQATQDALSVGTKIDQRAQAAQAAQALLPEPALADLQQRSAA
jgi:serine/threonine protein kinase